MEESERIRRYFKESGRWQAWPAGRAYLVGERRRLLQRVADTLISVPLGDLTVCDVGCGSGDDLAFWAGIGVPEDRLAGTELSADLAQQATARLPQADIRVVAGFEIPFASERFGLTTASLVLSTIRDDRLRRRLFEEMLRVTAPGGAVAVYDFRVKRPTNTNVVAMTRRRIGQLGQAPNFVRAASPLLPIVSLVLAWPDPMRAMAIRLLPRTHTVWAWRKSS